MLASSDQDFRIQADQFKERLWCRVVVPLVVHLVQHRHLRNSLMHEGHELGDGVPDIFRNRGKILKELLGDGDESILRPLVEPVDAGAVDQRWELATADPQGGAHRGEAEDHLQLLSHSVDEELPTVLSCVRDPRTLHLVPHNADDVV